jgi:hypothetical protein
VTVASKSADLADRTDGLQCAPSNSDVMTDKGNLHNTARMQESCVHAQRCMREQLCMQGLGVSACFLIECCYLIYISLCAAVA